MAVANRDDESNTAVEDPFLNVAEAAAYLNQTTRWVRRQVEEENVRFARLGRGLRFRRSWLDEYVEARTIAPEGGS